MVAIETIRPLVRNVDPVVAPLSDTEIESARDMVLGEVQARLQNLYPLPWPDPLPSALATVVRYLTAALLQERILSLTHTNASTNAYAQSLRQRGEDLLARIERGELVVQGLDARWRLPLFQAPTAPALYRPVRQYRSTGGG